MLKHLTSLAVAAILAAPGLAAAQANGPGYPAGPAYPAYGPPPHQRDTWYIGFGLGVAGANLTRDGATNTFGDYLGSNGTGMLQFEVGATARPDLLVGLDLRAVRMQGSGVTTNGDVFTDGSLQVTQALAMVTWFPARQGFFLRGGAGLAGLTEDLGAFGSTTHGGVGILGGLGYAFWLGQRFNLTLNLDASAQFYGGNRNLGEPESSRFIDGYVGFSWY